MRTLDPCIAPLRILARHPHHAVSDLSESHRAALPSSRTAVVLLGDQPPVPAEDRVRSDHTGHPHQCAPAESLTAHRETTALGVCEAKRSGTKLLAEDAILFSEIVDQIVLVAIHPAATVGTRKYNHGASREAARPKWPAPNRLKTIRPASAAFFAPYAVVFADRSTFKTSMPRRLFKANPVLANHVNQVDNRLLIRYPLRRERGRPAVSVHRTSG
jgi:hypothetical protein